VEAIVAGADAKSLNLKLKELEAEQLRARDALYEQRADRPLLHPNLAKIYRAKVESLGDALRNSANGREAFELVRSLIEEVRIVPCANALSLELKGDLAGILAMSDNRPDHSSAKALQIKMVAGIGFEPMTFRL
jgi:site-specific DNA recombinase